MDINTALKVFHRALEKRSITGAARDLGMSQPAATKHLRNLEEYTNTRLLERSPRSLRPTAHGVALYDATLQALASIDSAFEGLKSVAGALEGNIRIHAPSCLGIPHISDLLLEFHDAHPETNSELVIENKNVDSISENFDITIHLGKIDSQAVIVRRVGWIHRYLVAAPSFLEEVGGIDTVSKLSSVRFIATSAAVSPKNTVMMYDDRGRGQEVSVTTVFRTNTAQLVVDAVVAGKGVGVVQVNMVKDELQTGRLVRILVPHVSKSSEVFLTFPSTKFMRPVVREFTDFLIPRLRAIDGISEGPGFAGLD